MTNFDEKAIQAGFEAGMLAKDEINATLNTDQYSVTNLQGKRTGHGYAFEDLCNRKLMAEGHEVDSSIGKNCQWGGADALVDGKRRLQYKCCVSPEHVTQTTAHRNGYAGQELHVNTELAPSLRKSLKRAEREGRVPQGTARRVVDTGVTYEQAVQVSKPLTLESLKFDAESALATGGASFLTTVGTEIMDHWLYDKKTTFKEVKGHVKVGLCVAGLTMASHILENQLKRW